MLKIIILICVAIFAVAHYAQAQEPVRKERKKKQLQQVRGRILDKYSRQPVIGALISVDNVYPFLSAYSNDNGLFTIERVPVGRQTFSVEMKNYARLEQSNVAVSTGKETFIEFEITNNDEIENNPPQNEQLLVSSRSFSVEEVQRIPATFYDPSRLMMSFASITPIRDGDSDLNVRGNSTMSALYRLEGLDIPNPNHFASVATMGGGLTAFSTSVMNNTDFSTGAWSADYGNSINMVSDINFRKGNLFKREHNLQIGLLGLNAATEGPIKKERSSYLINYRYSTLGILSNVLGINFVRDNVSNTFQDLSFNLHFSSKNNKTTANVFGIGGISTERWTVRDTSLWTTNLDYTNNFSGSTLGILGINLNQSINERAFVNIVAGISGSDIFVYRSQPVSKTEINFIDSSHTQKYLNLHGSIAITYNQKIKDKLLLKTGIIAKNTYFELNSGNKSPAQPAYVKDIEGVGNTQLLQAFAQMLYRPTAKTRISGGLHSLFFTLNRSYSVEPRLAIKQQVSKKSYLAFAYGLHGAILPLGTYFRHEMDSLGQRFLPSQNLKMMKSHHIVLSYIQTLGRYTSLQIEGFFQHIFHAPIAADSSAGWYYHSRLYEPQGNAAYISAGVGQNYGVNLSLEKRLNQGYYFILATNVGKSRYQLLDKSWRIAPNQILFFNTLTIGREINLSENSSFQFNARIFFGEGTRFMPADTAATLAANKLVFNQTADFVRPNLYFRADVRAAFRKNFRKSSFVASLDIQNISNYKNQRGVLYDEQRQSIITRYHVAFTPVLNFQLFF